MANLIICAATGSHGHRFATKANLLPGIVTLLILAVAGSAAEPVGEQPIAAFASLYGSDPDRKSVLDVLAAFQKSLTTPNARFDRFLRGDQDALSAEEKRGYSLFKTHGCVACHQGANIGGNLFQKFGIFFD